MASLDQLERDVEQARARFANDLARLRDPQTLTQAKAEVVDKARAYKDEAIGEMRDGVASRAQSVMGDIQQRLVDNPTAAVLIGAGLAWHFFQKPPITTLLVGAGLFALFRPDVVEDLKHQVADAVQDRISDASEATQEQARNIADRVSNLADQANARMANSLQPVAEATSDLEDAVRSRVEENPLLYSLAAAAVGAAIGVTAKRRGTFDKRRGTSDVSRGTSSKRSDIFKRS
jgi:ElaB/YqjD/DUF883 family membrane-anchored ribosome-binding protein